MRTRIQAYRFTSLSDKFTFGAYNGQSLADVIDVNPEYLEWCVQEIDRFLIEDSAMNEINQIYPGLFSNEKFEYNRKWNLENWNGSENDCGDEPDYDDNYVGGWLDEPTYDRYNGSYAQDEMGYSDDDIDTIFDGDPDAYWNID